MKHSFEIALVGNPNCGKTTLFNHLANKREHTGNHPGITVEKKQAQLVRSSPTSPILLTDLPGIYALSSHSEDEIVAKKHLLQEKTDLILNIIDASNLERSLFLTTKLMELKKPMVVVLNMTDLLKKRGIALNDSILQNHLGLPVFSLSATQKTGIGQLTDYLGSIPFKNNLPLPSVSKFNEHTREHFIKKILSDSLTYQKIVSPSHRDADDWLCRRPFSVPFFLLLMPLLLSLVFGPFGSFLNQTVDHYLSDFFLPFLQKYISLSPFWEDLLFSGFFPGFVQIFSFVPQLILLYFLLSLLEDSGLLARAAYAFDPLLRSAGLSGKSFVPLLLGFGCTVTAVMATRTIPDKKERKTALLLLPFVSCSARVPFFALMASYFSKTGTILICLVYLLGIFVFLALASFRNKNQRKKQDFLLELPPYHIPSLRSVTINTAERTKDFLLKAGSILLLISLGTHFLCGYSLSLRPSSASQSILAFLSSGLSGLLAPIGLSDWRLCAALLTGIGAKESLLTTFSLLASESGFSNALSLLRDLLTPAQALSFFVFASMYFPCLATLRILSKEDSAKTALQSAVLCFVCSYFLAFLVYRGALLFL